MYICIYIYIYVTKLLTTQTHCSRWSVCSYLYIYASTSGTSQYIYIYIYVYAYIYIYMYIYIYICIYIYIYIIWMRVCVCVCLCVCLCVCVHMYLCSCIYTHIYTYIYIYIFTHTHSCTQFQNIQCPKNRMFWNESSTSTLSTTAEVGTAKLGSHRALRVLGCLLLWRLKRSRPQGLPDTHTKQSSSKQSSSTSPLHTHILPLPQPS